MQLVAGALTNDLATLFAGSGDRVFAFLLNRCGSRVIAEDLTTETFLSAARRFEQGRGAEVTEGWLITVARRRLVDHWRSQGAQRRRTERLVAEVEVERQALLSETDLTQVDEALASLSQDYRAALVLRYVEDFSVTEVADALGRSYKATESLLARARDAFSRAYEGQTC